MSYLKLCQICDTNGLLGRQAINGIVYIEDADGIIQLNVTPLTFPLLMLCEVLDWGTLESFQGRVQRQGSYLAVQVTVPDNSIPIRQSCYNQLLSTYPTLIM